MLNEDDPRHGATTLRSERPWGSIHMLVRNQPCSVDLTEVRPGQRSSLHSHAIRSELFHFLSDGAWLEVDGVVTRPAKHDEVLIRPGQQHRFWADETSFQMLVVCFGEWLASDQIRHEDDYGREGTDLRL